MQTADVVVIGGGVIGASVAWHLAQEEGIFVAVLDANPAPGMGSTGKATGGYRAQFGSGINVRLSLLAREKLLHFRDETGVDPGYRPCGYLFLADQPSTLAALAEAQAVQRAAGLHEARTVTPEEAREINPAISLDGIAGGVYCPTDGFIRPLQILRGYAEDGIRRGVRFEHGAPVERMEVCDGRVTAVRTRKGRYAAGVFVNAAGAWAGQVARMAGTDIPVTPLRRQVAFTTPTGLLPEDMPLTIFVDDGFHARVRDGRVMLLWPDDPRTTDPFDASLDEGWLGEVTARAHRRIPCLRGADIDHELCYGGLYEMSPDKHALLGAYPELPNFYFANGSSGHGVMHSPALGQLLAEMIVHGRATTMDADVLRPTRFREGKPIASPEFL